MAIKYKFFNAVESGGVYDRVYNAEDFTDYLGSLVGNGVFANPSTNMQVAANSGMTIKVKAGKGWINGHMMELTADENLSVSAASSSLPRIDRVVAYLDYTNRLMGVAVRAGTPASDPSTGKAALVRTSSMWELCLAEVYVAKNATAITTTNITDTRSDKDLCGWVTGMIDQVDTTTLYQQYVAAYDGFLANMQAAEASMANWMTSMQAQFDAWFETLTEELKIVTYIAKYEKHEVGTWDETTGIHQVTLDMLGYAYDSNDVILVYINGLKAVEGIDYSIFVSTQTRVDINCGQATTDQTIDIVVLKSKIGFNTLITSSDDPVVTDDDDDLVI